MSIDKRKDDLRQRIKDVHEELKMLEEWEHHEFSVDIPVNVTDPMWVSVDTIPNAKDVCKICIPEDAEYIPTLGQFIFRIPCTVSGVIAFHTFELTHVGVKVVDPYRSLRVGEEE